MKVAHVTATFPPYWAGTGNVVYHNARLMHERGHDVTVFTARTDRDAELAFPFRVEPLPAVFRIGNAPLTPTLIGRLGGFDLIHLHYPYVFGAELTLAAAKRHRVPLVVTYHNDLLARGIRGRIFRLYTELNQRVILNNVTRLVATSKDYAEHSFLADVAARKGVSVVPNGVDVQTFRPSTTPERHALQAMGLPTDAFCALFVGGLDSAHHFKGVEVLIGAVRRLPGMRAVIVGDGGLRSSYEARAERVAPGRVIFTGKVSIDVLAGLYREVDVTVLPSTTQGEAFGMVLIESMASGTPVIASDLPGVRTVVEQGVDGFLVPPGDAEALAQALSTMLDDPEATRAMGCAGRNKVVREYRWEVIGDRLEALYRETVGA